MGELGIFYPTIPEGGDFSTATVTVTCDDEREIDIYGAILYEEYLTTVHTIESNRSFVGVLYKGVGYFEIDALEIIIVSGEAELDDGRLVVNGDCTIKVIFGEE